MKKFLLFFPIIFNLFSISTSSSNSSIIQYEIDPFIRVYKNGRIQRLSGTQIVPPSSDPRSRVGSKDIAIDPKLSISARVFMPLNAAVSSKLPLLVYFHGGAFFTDSPFSPTYNSHVTSLVAKANVVAVSVNYRLAPEHLLPVAYEDSWRALKWVFSHCNGSGTDAWLNNYVDFRYVYLGGDSAGGNIAHNMAIRVGLEKMDQIRVHGMFLNCPHFWGSHRIGNEGMYPKRVAWVESIWIHAYPNSTGFDDPLSNPGMDPSLSELGCKRVLVYVAEMDVLKDRGWYYKRVLMEKRKWGGIVKVVEVKGEDHVFNLRFPNSPKSKEMLKHLALFLNNKDECPGDDSLVA